MIDAAAPVAPSIADIAASLAAQVRFAGHNPSQPTVAQHCLVVERIAVELCLRANSSLRALERAQRAALMHDASEALVGDTVGAVKMLMRAGADASRFDELEDLAQAAIEERYDCSSKGCEELVHEADCLACAFEMQGWHPTASVPSWTRLLPLGPLYRSVDGGERAFSARAHKLGMRDA